MWFVKPSHDDLLVQRISRSTIVLVLWSIKEMLTRRELIVSSHVSENLCHIQVCNTFNVMAQTQRVTLMIFKPGACWPQAGTRLVS